jgi:hypothetical protein
MMMMMMMMVLMLKIKISFPFSPLFFFSFSYIVVGQFDDRQYSTTELFSFFSDGALAEAN